LERMYRNRLLLLREWRDIAYRIARIVKNLYPEAKVHLIGGIAENRITVNSDIDIAVVFKNRVKWRRKNRYLNIY